MLTIYETTKNFFRPIWSTPIVLKFWHLPTIYKLRARIFNLYEKLNGYQRERRIFKKNLGYDLNLENPRSLNEKITWKKIYDRNPLLPLTADKYLVRDYVKKVLGEEGAEQVLIPLLYVTERPESINFNDFGDEYVIKSNHAGGNVIIVDKGNKLAAKDQVVEKLREWLKYPYSLFDQEWCYWPISPKIIIEKLIRDEGGNLAQDYKFHVFHGKCQFIHTTPKLNATRSGTRSLFTPDWKLMNVGWKYENYTDVPAPKHLKEMIEIAEKLAKPFDYVRVDLYSSSEGVKFGELTHYHGAAREPFYPSSADFDFGKLWNAKRNYWLENKE